MYNNAKRKLTRAYEDIADKSATNPGSSDADQKTPTTPGANGKAAKGKARATNPRKRKTAPAVAEPSLGSNNLADAKETPATKIARYEVISDDGMPVEGFYDPNTYGNEDTAMKDELAADVTVGAGVGKSATLGGDGNVMETTEATPTPIPTAGNGKTTAATGVGKAKTAAKRKTPVKKEAAAGTTAKGMSLPHLLPSNTPPSVHL
jgi:hypothetical protein